MRRYVLQLIAVLLAGILPAERLPVRNYTSLDGLPGISVHRIVCDSKGFLWFCTNEGVSRFDGYGFVNYGKADGLSDPNVYDILETREGSYWVGTAAGLFRLTNSRRRRGRTPAIANAWASFYAGTGCVSIRNR